MVLTPHWPARAQTTATIVVLPERGATLGEATAAGIGLRRGIRSVEGLQYVYPEELLSQRSPPDEFFDALERLPGLMDEIRQGSNRRTAVEISEVIDVFEANLDMVSRTDLAQAYLLNALFLCQQRRRRQCQEGFAYVLSFRETFQYDISLYPAEYAELFESTRTLLLTEAARGSLHVHTDPEGAEVFVDGRSAGPSPALVDSLVAGYHYVTVKASGFVEQVVRAEVVPDRIAQTEVSLEENSAALLLRQNLPGIRRELGRARAGPSISAMDGYLPVNQILLAVIGGTGGNHSIALYLYDLRTNFLLSHRDAQVGSDQTLSETTERLTAELYDGVSLDGQVRAPADPVPVDDGEVWEQWWFWTAVGVAVTSGAVTAIALAPSDPEIPSGLVRVTGTVR